MSCEHYAMGLSKIRLHCMFNLAATDSCDQPGSNEIYAHKKTLQRSQEMGLHRGYCVQDTAVQNDVRKVCLACMSVPGIQSIISCHQIKHT